MNKEEIKKITKEFSEKYGELLLLKANIAAINELIIESGKEEKLFIKISNILKKFDESQKIKKSSII